MLLVFCEDFLPLYILYVLILTYLILENNVFHKRERLVQYMLLDFSLCLIPGDAQFYTVLTFKRRIKSRLPFAGIIRSSPYSPRFQDNG